VSQTNRLIALVQAIGADIKALYAASQVFVQAADPGAAAAVGSIWVDTDDVVANVPVGLVTSLPAIPYDGEEIFFLADATNGVVWHLKYRAGSTSTYKWEYVGGGSLYSKVTTDETVAEASTVTYNNPATVGPSITLPLNGDFKYEMTSNMYVASETGNAAAYTGLSIGGAVPVAPDIMQWPGWVTGEFGAATTLSKVGSLLGRPAGEVETMKYYFASTAAGTAHVRWRELQITPIRVG
jgi:hypothetical protein